MDDRATFITSNEVVLERLAEIDSIADDFEKVKALVELAAQLLPSPSEVLAQALSAAIAIQNEFSRFRALEAIASQLPQTEPQLLEQALSVAIAIQNESSRSSALAAIMHQLPQTEPQLLEQALSAAIAIQSEVYRSSALVAIAPHLSQTMPQLLEQALSAAIAIQDESSRSHALAAISPQLPQTEPRLLEQALAAAIAIQDESYHFRALAAIAPHLPETERSNALEQALSAAIAIQDKSYLSSTLVTIASQLPETERSNVLEQALSAAIAIQYEPSLSSALEAIAPQLPQTDLKLLEQVLSAAIAIQDKSDRSKALAAIAPQLPEAECFNVLEQALSAAIAIQNESSRSSALTALAPQLPPTMRSSVLEQALSAAIAIQNESSRSSALTAIARQLLPTEPQLLEQALSAAIAIQNESSRSSALTAIAPQLPQIERSNVLEQALLAAIAAIQHEHLRSSALEVIVRQLPPTEPQLLEQALFAAIAIQDESYRSSTLAAIAPHLSQTEPQLLEQALSAAITIQNESSRSHALAAISRQLPQTELQLLEQALSATIAIQDESSRSSALAAITHQLPQTEPQLLEQALSAAIAIQSEVYRSSTLAAIAPQLPQIKRSKVLEQALSTAITIQDESSRSSALAAIAPQLPQTEPQLLEQALSAAIAIQSEVYRSSALAAIAPQLPQTEPQLLEQALSAAIAIQDESYRSSALAAIAPHLSQTEPQLLEQALSAAIAIQDESYRSNALAAIACQLPPTELKLLEQVLSAAITIQDGYERSIALAAIAPQLPEAKRFKVLEQALSAAITTQDEFSRSHALEVIAPQLPQTEPQLLEQVLSVAITIQDGSSRCRVLEAIAPQLLQTELQLLEQALSATISIQGESSEVYRSRALEAIVPQLPQTEPKLLERALSAAKDIASKSHFFSALVAVASRLPQTERSNVLEQELSVGIAMQNQYGSSPYATLAIVPEYESYSTRALEAIAPQLTQTEPKLLEQALSLASALIHESSSSSILVTIAPQLTQTEPKLLEQALSVASAIRNESDRSKASAAIASQLPQTYLPQLLAAISGLSKESAAPVLISPAVQFTEALAVQFPRDKHIVALEVVKVLPQGTDKTKFLSALAPQLPVGLLPSTLRLIQDTFTEDADRAEAFSNLFPYLASNQLPEAFNLITQSIKSPHHYTTALENLIPYLSVKKFSEILSSLSHVTTNLLEEKSNPETKPRRRLEPKLQARILCAVVTSLTNTQSILTLSQLPTPAELGADLAPQAKQTELSELIQTILHLAEELRAYESESFSFEKEAAAILSQLALTLLYIPKKERENKDEWENTLRLVFASVYQLTDISYQAQILSNWVPFLKDDEKDAEPFLETCKGDDYRALLNIKVQATFLSNKSNAQKLDRTLGELDKILKTIQSPFRKAAALVEISRYTADLNYQAEALQAIGELNDTYLKTQYLQHLIPCLSDIQRLEAARIIREILDQYYKVKALVALACKFPEFRSEARQEANKLEDQNQVQCIDQLSILAVEVPEILPNIIEIAKKAQLSETATDEEKRQIQLEHSQILVALAFHLPMRINREVNRERAAGRPITDDLWDRALYLLARGYRDALKGGTLRNESAQNKDFLNLQDEVNALADLLLMRDLEPPMTVGILGGWGGGKSYIMHLMQTRMTEVRSRRVTETEAWNDDATHEKLSPYVGHIYQIKFDAWTFAKSDLWASLMQTIFFELDRQLTLETQITTILNGISEPVKRRDLESKIWAVLYKTSDVDRQWFLEQVLIDKTVLNQISQQTQGETTGQLWKTLNSTQKNAIEQLKKTQQQLDIARRELDVKKAAIRKEINDQFAPLLKIHDLSQNQNFKRVDALLGTSFILLRQRIGPQLFKQFQNEIYTKLYEDSGNVSASDKSVGLWQQLSQTLEDLETAKKELALVAAERQPPQASTEDFTATPTSTTDPSGTTEPPTAQPSDEAIQQRKAEIKEKIDTLFQKAEELKLDIQTVAANVIEQQYWKVSWHTGWQWGKKNWLLLLLFLGFFISPLLLWNFFQINPIAAGTATLEQILTRMAALIAPTLPALVTLQALLRSSHKWFDEAQLALHEYEKSVENRNKKLEKRIETTVQERLQEDSELEQLERNVRQLETRVEQQKHALPVNEYASLNDFVTDRLSSKTYANRLGLMQQVKEDLFDLSNKLLPPSGQSLESKIKFLKETFPRGPARVIVYIDDLDRCPPDRVVQVLEAVQLLVKTPLFIAVLAIDERYITRALEKFYQGVLSKRGRPSGSDYLEKIIQLPYRVRPIMANTLESYLRSQILIQDSATGGAKFSEFSRQEFNMLLACCQQVDLSPRTLKRLTNVYKLFKIVCRTRGTKPNLQVQQTILALLALSGRYPSLMRGIFDSIETCFEEQRTPEKAKTTLQTLHLRSPLRDFFKQYRLAESDRHLQRDFEKLKHDALQTAILSPALTLEDMTHEIFNLIRSFSFVGEIGEDPEDYRISETTADDQSEGTSTPINSENN